MYKLLEYGKWYSVKECMPEDFEELVAGIRTVDVLCYSNNEHTINNRVYEHTWHWEYYGQDDNSITNWMAIPKLT